MEKPRFWPQDDGDPITCHEKLRLLTENWQEVQDIMRDAFEDAMLMGVNEQFMRARLKEMVDSLASPKNGSQPA